MRIPLILCGLGLGVGLWAGGGCQPDGPQGETGTSEGSETDSCTPGSQNCVCGEGSSCEPGLLCASQRCVPDNGVTTSDSGPQTTTVGTDDSGVATETSGDSTDPTASTETGATECDPAMGVINAKCSDPAAPYCSGAGSCVACDAIDCGETSAATPICDASGQCVQCNAGDDSACGGATPICDAEAVSCVACTDHAQCDSGACQLDTGACFEAVLYVDRAAPCGGDGSSALPFCEIQDAVATIDQGDPTVVRVKPSPSPYSKQVQVAPNRTVAIVRDGTGIAKLEVDALDSLVVNDGATAYLSGMQISKGEVNKGIYCTNAKLRLDRTQVVDRKGLGIDGVACNITLRQSRVYLNLGGGIKLTGGSLRLENSFVVSNGGAFAAISGIVITNVATIDALYTTIVDNDGKAGVEDSIDCTNPGEVKLRNSIVFGQSAVSSVGCVGATATTSVFDSSSLTGDGNKVIEFVDPAWFVAPETGNFSINPGPPFEDAALWKAGDPTVDYDGTMRPPRDGAKDFAGADRPK